MRRVFKFLLENYKVKKIKNRRSAWMRNNMYRSKLKQLFVEWRTIAHDKFRNKLKVENKQRWEEQSQLTLNEFAKRVDALVLYKTQLQARIDHERGEIDQLMRDYEGSVAMGTRTLGQETETLA